MKKYLMLLACLPTLLNSQVYDDFADGNLTNDPIWNGTTGTFKVNNSYQLQLADSSENISYLSTSSVFSDETEWQIWVRLAFSPSSNNLARIYLLSDKTDLTQPLNGYFLQLGESGSSDALELFRQDGLDNFSVCRGTEGFISSSFSIRIKVTRDETGFWQILTDPNGGEAFQLQAEGMDDFFPEAGYLGLYCQYTKSNASKMYFDDIYSGPWIVDQLPPAVLEIVADSDSSLQLHFDEPLERTEAEYPDNYIVSQGIGSPVMASISEDLTRISLLFSKHFVSGQNYLLSISGIKDLAGNLMEPVELAFNFHQIQVFDIVINEIMADPSPPAGLPDYEYLELFNCTGYSINLDQWILQIGESEREIQGVSILPDGYLILGREEARPELEQFGPFYGFSSFSLTNAGQEIILKDSKEIEVSRVSYNENWHSDPSKMEGGWSLEQINPDDVCASELNWRSSENSKGGTPGMVNSADSDQAMPPAVSYLEVMDEHNLMLLFTQSMNMESLSQRSHYFVEDGIGNPSSVTTFDDQSHKLGLYFEKPLENGILYRLTIDKNLQNCIGNRLEHDTSIYFGLAAMAEENDILINEILFNPWLNGSDYVEIYNKSEKVIDLSLLKLGTVKVSPPNPNDTLFYSISQRQLLMLPSSYLVLTKDPEAVKSQYFPSYPEVFVMVNPFPAYGNDNGSCLLASHSNQLLDAFDYAEDMHYPLLNYVKGVSLERTGSTGNSQDVTNWHSASENAGFGTPGYRNSQMVSTTSVEDEIEINPEIFSPDNDGYNDIASIDYHFGQAGYMMTVKIFNSGGNLVRNLVNNKYLGTEGSVYWDGIQDDNTKSPIGIYVFYIQVWDLNGQVKKYKRTVVVAAKLQ